jgi:two-component system response regulator QseB
MRILIVEDDSRLAHPIAAALRTQRHSVETVLDGASAVASCGERCYDLVLLDIMLPDMSGVKVCRSLRQSGSRLLVMMMTARGSTTDKVTALDGGADDYIVKPFDMAELLARVRALARRQLEPRLGTLRHGRLELDPTSAEVRYDGRPIALTRTEYDILATMLRQPRRVFSSDMLYARVAATTAAGSADAIKSHIANLRKKLHASGLKQELIATVYGFGYRLADA